MTFGVNHYNSVDNAGHHMSCDVVGDDTVLTDRSSSPPLLNRESFEVCQINKEQLLH